MKLSLQLKAVLITVGLFAVAAAGGTLVAAIFEYVSTETILRAFGIGFVAFFAYMFYTITLAQLKYKAKLEEMVDKK